MSLLYRIRKIREEYMPTLVHTHFDGYDLAVNKVFFNGVKIVWHMHNHLSYVNHPLKAIYQMWCFCSIMVGKAKM